MSRERPTWRSGTKEAAKKIPQPGRLCLLVEEILRYIDQFVLVGRRDSYAMVDHELGKFFSGYEDNLFAFNPIDILKRIVAELTGG